MHESGRGNCQIQKLKPDIYGDEILTSWLSELDGKYCIELMGQEAPVSYAYTQDSKTVTVKNGIITFIA